MVRITQLTESILVGWPDVHGHTITFHQALVSIVTAEFISYFPIFLFSYGNQIDVNRHGQNQRNLKDGLIPRKGPRTIYVLHVLRDVHNTLS